MTYAASSTSLLLMVRIAFLFPKADGVKFTTKLAALAAATLAGKDATVKSLAFAPEITALEIFKVFAVPSFSMEKVVGVIVANGEFMICVPPDKIVAAPCFTLISCCGVAAPAAILTSSNPILPETLLV